MAMMNATQIPPGEPSGMPKLAQSMAYSQASQSGAYNSPTTYRLSRGFPLMRRGIPVQAIPKFKALAIYTHTPTSGSPGTPGNPPANQTAPPSFRNTNATPQAGTNTWPIGPR